VALADDAPAEDKAGLDLIRIRLVTAPIESCRVVCIRIGDSYVRPAIADVAAVQDLRPIRLRHGYCAVPSHLGGAVAKPGDPQPKYLGQHGHRPFDVCVVNNGQIIEFIPERPASLAGRRFG
jgi:hypothetical protein